jgi:hypothetical protein
MQTTSTPFIVPKTSSPEWPSTVLTGKPSSSAKAITILLSSSSASTPSPEPKIKAAFGLNPSQRSPIVFRALITGSIFLFLPLNYVLSNDYAF